MSPEIPDFLEFFATGREILKTPGEVARVFGILSRAKNEADFPFLPDFQFHLDLQRGAGIEGNAGLSGKARAPERGRLGECSIAPKEFGAVGRVGTRQFAAGHEG